MSPAEVTMQTLLLLCQLCPGSLSHLSSCFIKTKLWRIRKLRGLSINDLSNQDENVDWGALEVVEFKYI